MCQEFFCCGCCSKKTSKRKCVKDEGFVFCHGFRGFSPSSVRAIALCLRRGKTSWQDVWQRRLTSRCSGRTAQGRETEAKV